MHPSIEGFWWFVRERETIRTLRAGLAAGAHVHLPDGKWTDDPILQKYHFCNIRRKDDHGTHWYLDQIPRLVTSSNATDILQDVLWRTMLYRLVNNTAWFEAIGNVFNYPDWSTNRKHWAAQIRKAPKPHSPAYIVLQAPGSTGRAAQLIKVLDRLSKGTQFVNIVTSVRLSETLEEAWSVIKWPYGMGPFIALQVVRDLLLIKALPFKENDWTFLGPGAREGLQLLAPNAGDGSRYGASYKVQYELCLKLHAEQPGWLESDPLVLGDVEHCLCEYAKYIKFRQGRGRRRRYKPHDVHNIS